MKIKMLLGVLLVLALGVPAYADSIITFGGLVGGVKTYVEKGMVFNAPSGSYYINSIADSDGGVALRNGGGVVVDGHPTGAGGYMSFALVDGGAFDLIGLTAWGYGYSRIHGYRGGVKVATMQLGLSPGAAGPFLFAPFSPEWANLTSVSWDANEVSYGSEGVIDDIRFSPLRSATPEPGTLMLLGSGLVGLIARRRYVK